MNETLKTIQTRRSCRAFTGAAIAHTDLEAIAVAGAAAPSARNRHTRRLTVVQDKALLEKLACLVADAVGAGSDYNFYRPDALILLSDTSENPLAVEDCACALENIFLAAESLGIGSVWINQFRGICGRPEIRRALSALGLPEDHNVWGCAALGYPAQPNETPRKQDAVAWF